MSPNYTAKDSDKAYFITMTIVEWIDLFTRLNHKNTIINSLKYCQQKKGLEIYAYVIMPSHIHMLCRVTEGYVFSDFIRDFKRHTAKQLTKNIIEEPESRREWLLQKFREAALYAKKEQVLAGFFFHKTQQHKIWFRKYTSWFFLTVPVINELIKKIYLARFCQSMKLLLGSKVLLIDALSD